MQLWREFRYFLLHEKKCWLLPMLVVAAACAAFLVLGSTSAGAAFTYDIF